MAVRGVGRQRGSGNEAAAGTGGAGAAASRTWEEVPGGFSPLSRTEDFWPPGLYVKKPVPFPATEFVVAWYSCNRKQTWDVTPREAVL